jgi:threonine dehydrogenase-like Zn-dependent dehydrogenase
VRRKASLDSGVTQSLDPGEAEFWAQAMRLTGNPGRGYDLTLELTGNPAALDSAIDLTTFTGRIVLGSWYGSKTAPVKLGGKFHRSRITILPSQVSTIAPQLQGRWDKGRRFQVAWKQLRQVQPARWITHRFSLDEAAEAYRMVDRLPESTIQVVFRYS